MVGKIYNVKINNSPSHSNLEVAGNLVIKLHVPYSNEKVTIKVNPNITEYKEKAGNNVRQYTEIADTDETKTLSFDFHKNNIHNITISGKNYKIRLLNIGTALEQGQNFPYFEFYVEEL